MFYFDTSAIVPLIIAEASSERCRQIWTSADMVVTSRLTYVEASAAVGAAHRRGGTDLAERRSSARLLDQLWDMVDVIEFDSSLMHAAAEASIQHALRGYDAVHYASAVRVASTDLVAVAGDRALLSAWARGGLAIADANGV